MGFIADGYFADSFISSVESADSCYELMIAYRGGEGLLVTNSFYYTAMSNQTREQVGEVFYYKAVELCEELSLIQKDRPFLEPTGFLDYSSLNLENNTCDDLWTIRSEMPDYMQDIVTDAMLDKECLRK